ncbi:MAG: hypothetical protein WCH39_19655, partial [Schlesneria sp.]
RCSTPTKVLNPDEGAQPRRRCSTPAKVLFEGRMGLIGLMGPIGPINEEFTDDEGAHVGRMNWFAKKAWKLFSASVITRATGTSYDPDPALMKFELTGSIGY